MKRLGALAIALAVIPNGSALAACASYPYNLTNGTTADATQVMANFNCAALTSGTTLENVVRIGIGGVGTNALDVTQSGGSPTIARVLNSTTGAGAIAALQVANAAGHTGYFYMFGSAFTPSGMRRADGAYLAGDGAGGLTINTDTSQPIYFGINSSEVGRFATNGSLLLNTTTSGGWTTGAKLEAYANANTAISAFAGSGNTGQAFLSRVDNTTAGLMMFYYTTTNVGSIKTNGTTTSYNTTSDERLKDWTIPQRDYENTIRNIWVGDFRWRKTGESSFGYRAQQAFSVFPAAVSKPQRDGQWQMDYGKTAPLALWGVKDLYKRVDRQAESIALTRNEVGLLVKEVADLRKQNEQALAQVAHLRLKLDEMRMKTGERWARN